MDQTKESIFNPVYEYNISSKIGKEYIPMVEDLVRMTILQFIVQFMFFIRNPYEYSLFDTRFIEMLLYLVLGLCVYWLLFKRLVKLS